MDLREVFATNLRRLRHEKGLSQDDLAYEAEVSRSYLSQLEKGAFYTSLKIIGRLAEALGAEPAELLRRPAGTVRNFVRGWAVEHCSGHCPGEALAEEHGELGLGHAPLARRHDPLLFRPVQDQEEEL